MKRLLFILAAGLIAVTAQADNHKKSADASVTIVASETDADATHVYLSQDDSTDSGMTKMTYDENPKAFAQGWRDGWKSASKQSDLSSDQPAENIIVQYGQQRVAYDENANKVQMREGDH